MTPESFNRAKTIKGELYDLERLLERPLSDELDNFLIQQGALDHRTFIKDLIKRTLESIKTDLQKEFENL